MQYRLRTPKSQPSRLHAPVSIRAGLFILVALLLLPGVAASQAPSAPPDTGHKLTLIGPNDRDFDSLLTSNFPGIDLLDGFRVVRPFLVVLRNDTSHAARTYMMVWDREVLGAPGARPLNAFFTRYDPAPAVSRVALAPGELRLVAPTLDVSPEDYRGKKHSWVASVMHSAGEGPPYSMADTKSVIPSVDVVFDDGACTGANRHQTFERYQHEIDSERELAEQLLQLMDARKSAADIVAFLKNESDVASSVGAGQVGEAGVHAFFRGGHIQKFLSQYRSGGIEAMMTRAWAITRYPPLKLVRVSPE